MTTKHEEEWIQFKDPLTWLANSLSKVAIQLGSVLSKEENTFFLAILVHQHLVRDRKQSKKVLVPECYLPLSPLLPRGFLSTCIIDSAAVLLLVYSIPKHRPTKPFSNLIDVECSWNYGSKPGSEVLCLSVKWISNRRSLLPFSVRSELSRLSVTISLHRQALGCVAVSDNAIFLSRLRYYVYPGQGSCLTMIFCRHSREVVLCVSWRETGLNSSAPVTLNIQNHIILIIIPTEIEVDLHAL